VIKNANIKPIDWVGTSRKDLKSFSEPVQQEFGYKLYMVQLGEKPEAAKPLSGMPGVMEIVTRYDTDTYRTVYVTKLKHAIYVLHAFKKKSKKGIKTPKQEIDLIKQRLRIAKEDDNDRRNH